MRKNFIICNNVFKSIEKDRKKELTERLIKMINTQERKSENPKSV